MKFKAIYKYRLRENAFGGLSYMAVMTVVMGCFVATSYLAGDDGSMNLSTFGMSSIMFFVLGIVCILEDLRFGIQGGVSRRTVLLANLAAAAVLSLVVAVVETALYALTAMLMNPQIEFTVRGTYQMLFLRDAQAAMNGGEYGGSILFGMVCQLSLYVVGVFFALLFYRLSKFGRVIAGILMGGILLVGLPFVSWKLAPYLSDLAQWALTGLGNWLLLAVPLGALVLAVDYLLLRRTPIRGRK